MALLLLAACGRAPVDCDAQTGLVRDGCLGGRIGELAEPAAVVTAAKAINDPLVRDAAVLHWVEDHRRGLAPADGQALCGLLSERERNTCQRRLSAPHLAR